MSIRTDPTNRPDTSQQAPSPSGPRLWSWSWSRPRRWLLAAVAAVAAVAVALILGNPGSISIVSGWFPVLLSRVTAAVCVIAVVLRRDVRREFAVGIPVGLAFAVLLYAALRLTQAIPAGAPRSMYAWLGVTCLVAGLVLASADRVPELAPPFVRH